VRACVRPSDATVPRFNSPAELTGRTGRACIFYGRTGGGPNRWRILGFCHSVRPSGRREKWRWTQRKVTGKRKDDRRMESFRGPEPQVLRAKYRGPETQVLRSRSRNLALGAWNPGPEIQVLKPRVEVLKPRSWERACVINWLKKLMGTH
jgi:hypothetical protein